MSERDWIEYLAGTSPLIGDDAAVISARIGEDLLVSTDAQVEEVHFRRAWAGLPQLAVRALAAAASDVAAMGGEGRYFLSTLLLPPEVFPEAGAIWEALREAGRRWGFEPAGGDTTRAERLAFDFTVIGSVPKGKAVRRDGARAGDILVLTGPVGSSRAGLVSMERGLGLFEVEARLLSPRPRLVEGQRLRAAKARAMIDISDGLGLDLDRIGRASGVACVLEDVPLDPLAPVAARAVGEDPDFFCLASGEEYGLVASVPPEAAAGLAAEGYRVVGRVRTPGSQVPPGAYLERDGTLYALAMLGHDHFA